MVTETLTPAGQTPDSSPDPSGNSNLDHPSTLRNPAIEENLDKEHVHALFACATTTRASLNFFESSKRYDSNAHYQEPIHQMVRCLHHRHGFVGVAWQFRVGYRGWSANVRQFDSHVSARAFAPAFSPRSAVGVCILDSVRPLGGSLEAMVAR
jgi:hypothetical protein